MSWKFGKFIAVEEVAYERDEMYMAVGKDLKLLGKKGGLFMESSCTKTRGDSLWNPRVQKTRGDSLWNPRGQKPEQAVFPGFERRISTAATFDRREYLWDYSLKWLRDMFSISLGFCAHSFRSLSISLLLFNVILYS